MSTRRKPPPAREPRYDHCDCPTCDGKGTFQIIHVTHVSTGYGYTKPVGRPDSVDCADCDGRGKALCFHDR